MILLILTISFNLLSTGSPQELNNVERFKLPQPNLDETVASEQSWPVQTIQTVHGNFFGQAFRNINPKPCSGRRNLQNLEDQWIPTFSAKLVKPNSNVYNSNLMLQPVEEEHISVKYAPVVTPTIQNDPVMDLDNENKLFKTRNSLSFDEFEDKMEDVPEQHDAPVSEDRLGFNIMSSDEDTFSVVNDDEQSVERYNTNDEIFDNVEESELKSMSDRREPENKTTFDESEVKSMSEQREPENKTTFNSVESNECTRKQQQTRENVDPVDESRRFMPKLNQQNNMTKYNIDTNLPDTTGQLQNTLKDNNNNVDTYDIISPRNKNKNVNFRNSVAMREMTDKKSINEFEPTKGTGVSELSKSRMMLMDHSRLCYACSTASNPTCWTPDRKTTVKYCRKGHEACVTKTFETGNTLTLVRDCGNSCTDVDIPGFAPKYKSCSICHSDMCNGAYSININNVIFAFSLITLIKCVY